MNLVKLLIIKLIQYQKSKTAYYQNIFAISKRTLIILFPTILRAYY